MRSKVIVLFVLGIFLLNVFGCASVPQEHQGAATGAGIGAATGAVAGAIVGGHAESIVIGGLLGALIGGAVGHYAVDKKRTAQETNNRYNYQSSTASIRIEETLNHPNTVKPGEKVDLTVTYAVLGVPEDGQIDLVEKREITHNNELVGNPEVTVARSGGTFTSKVPLYLPQDARPGLYKVKTTIQTPYASDVRESTFHVQ